MTRAAIIHASSLCRITDSGQPRRGVSQGELNIIADGAVIIEDGHVAAVGSTNEVAGQLANVDDVFDAHGMTVLPGLVEAHSHPVFAGSRYMEYGRRLGGASLDEIVAEGGGIWNSVLTTRAAGDDLLLNQVNDAAQAMLNDGITTAEMKSGYGLTVEQELRSLAILAKAAQTSTISIVPTFLGAHVVPAGMTAEAYVDNICNQMLPAVAEQGIAKFHDVTCEVGYFDRRQAERLIRASESAGLPVRVHADAWKPSGGWAVAAGLHCKTGEHVTFATDEEVRVSAGTDTMAVLLPVAESLYMGEKRANARLLIESDIPVVVATDYCSSIPVASLRLAIGLASPWFRMTPGEAIVGATLNAAYAVGVNDRAGSLDPGKDADILLLGCEHPFQFSWEFGLTSVVRVLKGGRVVVDRSP